MNMQTAHGPPMPSGTPSRRGVILGGLLIPAAATLALPGSAQAHALAWADALPSISFLHPRGRTAALAAMAAGLDPADLYCIVLGRGSDAPKLLFSRGDRGWTVSGDGSLA